MKQTDLSRFFRIGKQVRIAYLFFLFLGSLCRPLYGQTYSFTPAGATGAAGPTQAQINSAYASTNLSGLVISASGIQTWTVPVSGLYRIDVSGAAGGNSTTSPFNPAGSGSRMVGEFNLLQNDVIRTVVGQKGLTGVTGSGGGGTYVTRNNVLLIVAGGGGGGTSNQVGANSVTLTAGTNDNPGGPSAGGTNGNGGQTCNTGINNSGGGGGYLTDGATGTGMSTGFSNGGGGLAFMNGSAGGSGANGVVGGFGGGGGVSVTFAQFTGGGGGGGYSGGAGGQQTGNCMTGINRSGGGGGGSYNTGSNQANTGGVNTGDGISIVTLLCAMSLTSNPPSICSGGSATLTSIAVSGYSWSTGSTASSIVVTPASTTTYSFSGTGATGCVASSAITVSVSSSAPTVAVSSSTPSTCYGNTVSITATGALSYTISSGVTNGVAFLPAPGTNVYTVTGVNGCGSQVLTTTITVSALPVTTTVSSSVICAGKPATLTATGATTYTWAPGSSTLSSIVVSPNSTTVYTVSGSTGACSGLNTVTITTKPNPTLSISASTTTICNGNQVTLNVTGNATTYTWSPVNQQGSSISDFPGNTTLYSVSGTNSVGCIATTQQVVVVNPLPIVNATASNPLICSGGSSTLAASGASTYAWTGGSGATASVMVVNPTLTQTYTVAGTSSLGCTSSTMLTVTIYSPTISVSSGISICSGSNTILNAGVADTYSWSNGTNTQNNPVNPTQTTTYTLNAMVNNLNGLSCAATNTVQVTVNQNPTITATANRTIICVGETATLTASGAGATGTYTFTGGSGSVVSPTNAVTPIADQNYTITGIDANGCKGKGTFNLLVSQCTGISINSANAANLSVYPNPSTGDFVISTDQAITLQISNELGQLVRSVTLNKNNMNVRVSSLPAGIYFITGKNENGSVKEKIIIEK